MFQFTNNTVLKGPQSNHVSFNNDEQLKISTFQSIFQVEREQVISVHSDMEEDEGEGQYINII